MVQLAHVYCVCEWVVGNLCLQPTVLVGKGTHWENKKALLYMVFKPLLSSVNSRSSVVHHMCHDDNQDGSQAPQQDARRACTDAEGHSADDDGKHFH